MKQKYLAILGTCLALSACNYDSDNNNSGSSSTPSTALHGIAATGAPISNGTIDLKCLNSSASYSTSSDANGNYSINVSDTPCVIRVTFGSPAQTLYSLATAAGVSNISPFTDLVFTALAQSAPDAAFSGFPGNATGMTSSALTAAIDLTQRRLNNLGVDVSSLDLLHQVFSPKSGDAYDDKLEALKSALQAQSLTLANLEDDVAHGRDQPQQAAVQTPVLNMAEPGDGLVRLSWTPAQSGVTYDVYYDLVTTPAPGSPAPQPTQSILGASSPVNITGLTNGSQYYFIVKAHNGSDVKSSGQLTSTPHSYGINFTTYSGYSNNGVHPRSAAYVRTYDSRDVYVGVYDTQNIVDVELSPVDGSATPQDIDVRSSTTSPNTAVPLYAVAGGKGYLIAAGALGTILYSQNGHSWTQTHVSIANTNTSGGSASSPVSVGSLPESGVTYRSITYANGKFVLAGSYSLTDGNRGDLLVMLDFNAEDAPSCPTSCSSSAPYYASTTYLSPGVSNGGQGLAAVSYGNSGFVAMGGAQGFSSTNADDPVGTQLKDGSTFVYTSSDGSHWTQNTISVNAAVPSPPASMAYYSGYLYAMTDSAGGLYRSSNGLSWSNIATISFPGSHPLQLAVGPGQMITTDELDDVFHSSTGTSWKSTNGTGGIPSSNGASAVTYGNGRYVAFGSGVYHSE